jgi:hypothetical protein
LKQQLAFHHTMKVAFHIALVLCCIATVCAKMPWGLPERRFVVTVKSGSAEESLHAGDKTNRTVGDDDTRVRVRDGIPPSNSTVGDGGTTVWSGDGIPPSNTPPPKKHSHHKGGFSMSPSTFCENGLTNAGCYLANARVEASMNIRKGMVDGMGDASMNIRKGMVDGMGEASENIRKGMVAIGVCMVLSNEKIVIGVCKAVSSWWLGRASS